jgi:hypothetical protein
MSSNAGEELAPGGSASLQNGSTRREELNGDNFDVHAPYLHPSVNSPVRSVAPTPRTDPSTPSSHSSEDAPAMGMRTRGVKRVTYSEPCPGCEQAVPPEEEADKDRIVECSTKLDCSVIFVSICSLFCKTSRAHLVLQFHIKCIDDGEEWWRRGWKCRDCRPNNGGEESVMWLKIYTTS